MIELTKLKFEGYIMGTIFISEQACSPLKKYLKNSEHNIIFVKKARSYTMRFPLIPTYICAKSETGLSLITLL